MMELGIAALAMSAVSAVGQIKAGNAANAQYKGMANVAEFQGRNDAIRYKQQGVKSLDGLVRSNAAVNAAAGAGLVRVDLTGSAGRVQQANMRTGMSEFNLARNNAIMATELGNFQAQLYRAAGRSAKQAGIYSAIGTVGKGFMAFGQMGGFGGIGGGGGLASPGAGAGGGYSPGFLGSFDRFDPSGRF